MAWTCPIRPPTRTVPSPIAHPRLACCSFSFVLRRAQSVVSSAVTSFLSGVGVGPILKSIYFDFKSSVTYPDLLVIGSRLVSLQQDRFSVTHRLVSCGQERTVGESEGVIVTFDWTSKAKADVPSIVRRALEAAMEEQRQADLIAPMVKPPRATVNFGPQTAGKR